MALSLTSEVMARSSELGLNFSLATRVVRFIRALVGFGLRDFSASLR